MLTRDAVSTLIPHAGSMLLIDEVLAWSGETILCATACHRDPRMPLRRDERLPVVSGVEFAGQATAIHGALVAGRRHKGMLAAVRNIRFSTDRLDDVDADLFIAAQRELGGPQGAVYRFAIGDGRRTLVTGRLTAIVYA